MCWFLSVSDHVDEEEEIREPAAEIENGYLAGIEEDIYPARDNEVAELSQPVYPRLTTSPQAPEALEERVIGWVDEVSSDGIPQTIAEEDFSDHTITLHQQDHLDSTNYSISVNLVESAAQVEAEFEADLESTSISFFIDIARKIERLDVLKGISTDDPIGIVTQVVNASRKHDKAGRENSHELWSREIVIPVLTEAIRIFRRKTDEEEETDSVEEGDNGESDTWEEDPDKATKEVSEAKKLLDWFYLPGGLFRPYVVEGIDIPVVDKEHLGFDIFQLLRPDHEMRAGLYVNDEHHAQGKIDPRKFQGLIAVIRPCATEPSGVDNQSHRILFTLRQVVPTIQVHLRHLWQINNILTHRVGGYETFETWLPVLLYEGSEWHLFVAKPQLGEIAVVKIEWSANTSSASGCNKLLSLLVVLLSWAKYIHLSWLINVVFDTDDEELDDIWNFVTATEEELLGENTILTGLLQSLPCGMLSPEL